MAPSSAGPSDDFLKTATASWWQSLRFRWLLAAPLLAFPLVLAIHEPLQSVSDRVRATWQLDQALRAARDDDPAAALEKVNEAIAAWPTSVQLYLIRGTIQQQLGNFRASLDDYDIAVHLAPSFAEAYERRASVRRLLGYGRDALEDIEMVVALRPRDDPNPLNQRAYYRALEGVELEAALDDIQRAIDMAETAPAGWLDTRACVLLALGELDNALRDADDAIRLAEKSRQKELDSQAFKSAAENVQRRAKKQRDELLSVLYHHRAQIHAAIGEPELAAHDEQQALSLGFRPEIE